MKKNSLYLAFLLFGLPALSASAQITQEAYVKAGTTGEGDRFGTSIAVDGDTMVVTAIGEDSLSTGVNGNPNINGASGSGAAYVFVRENGTWVQQAFLKASNAEGGADTPDGLAIPPGDNFGYSCAISGDTIVIGSRWEDSNARGVNGDQSNNGSFNAGAAYVFVREGTTWTQQAYLKASNTLATADEGFINPDSFGISVAIDQDTIVVGARYEDSGSSGVNGDQSLANANGDSGAAYVFVREGDTWSQQAFLKQSNNLLFITPGGLADSEDNFGGSVAVSGDTIAIAASLEDGGSQGINGDQTSDDEFRSGAVYVFGRNGTTWTQQAYIKADNADDIDVFGSLDLEGTTLVVGASQEDSNGFLIPGTSEFDGSNNFVTTSGAVYVFEQDPLTLEWSQQAFLKASNPSRADAFGAAVSLSGDTIVVGARSEDSDSIGIDGAMNDDGDGSGAVYVFKRMGSTWVQDAFIKASNSREFGLFGVGVAISGDTIVASNPGDDSASPGINGDQFNEDAPGAGAVFVFEDAGSSFATGDVNCDGDISFDDIAPFVVALANPNLDPKADINRDGTDDFDDIAPFIILLVAG